MVVEVEHDELKSSFFVDIEGKQSRLDYKRAEDERAMELYSTYVPCELRGHQVGHSMVKAALRYALDHGLKVIPTCPFVRKVVDKHPKFEKLLIT